VVDETRSLELVRMALAVAEQTLVPGGAFVAKVFMGGDFPGLQKDLRARFEKVLVARPQATRDASYEVYVVGTGFRAAPAARSPAAEVPSRPAPPLDSGAAARPLRSGSVGLGGRPAPRPAPPRPARANPAARAARKSPGKKVR
jgi:23S rRNA (uridine2552-2'-O)-methyltransferase